MSEDLKRFEAALSEHYRLGREIGSGGMATVYLAEDLKHDREVAVKVLRPDLAVAVGPDRFLREIKITAKLNHPHVLPLLDSGDADGFLYYVMPYVSGGSLRRRLTPDTPLPLDVATRVARQVADALDHAHSLGIVHRDIKPENILFSDSHAVVSDFGIAKAVATAGREALTRTGAPLGTPGYMSPEQAMGTAELNERTDVYSLACVVYEMLVGATPAVWPMEEDVRLGRMSDAPADHRERLDSCPGRVEQVLTRALAVRPSDRFPSPGELADALVAAAEGSGRKLSDSEVRQVIGRAAELQAEQPTEGQALSVGAVEQVAAEVGIPPDRVRVAVRELDRRPSPALPAKKNIFPKEKLIVDRTIDGEADESQYEAMVNEIQRTLGIVGHISTLGRTLTWSPADPGSDQRNVVITITPGDGRTQIHIEERLELSGWRIFIPAWGGGAGVITGLLLATFFGLSEQGTLLTALPLGAIGGFTAVQLFFGLGGRKHGPQLEQLADRLADRLSESARPALPRNRGS